MAVIGRIYIHECQGSLVLINFLAGGGSGDDLLMNWSRGGGDEGRFDPHRIAGIAERLRSRLRG